MALAMKDALEGAHMQHPDFRVHGRIFATLHPDNQSGVVKLTPEQQQELVHAFANIFVPAAGAWGLQGYTTIRLAAADEESVGEALTLAWRNVARDPRPKRRAASPKRRPAPPSRSPRRRR